MIIRSQAGEFEMSIEAFKVADNQLVMSGKMGVWDASLTMTPAEVLSMFGRLLSSGRIILFLFKMPFLAMRQKHDA